MYFNFKKIEFVDTSSGAIRMGECSEEAKTILSWTISSLKSDLSLSLLVVSSPQIDDFNGMLFFQLGLFLLSKTVVPAVLQPFLPDIFAIATAIFNQSSDPSKEQRQSKTIDLALRMVLNMFALFTPATIVDLAPSASLTAGLFSLLLQELDPVEQTIETEQAGIIDLSLEVLVLFPINEISCIDEKAVATIGLLTQFIRYCGCFSFNSRSIHY